MATIDDLKSLSYEPSGGLADNYDEETGQWSGGAEITASKLNRIDNGILNATLGVNDLATAVGELQTQMGTIGDDDNSGILNEINALDTRLDKIDGGDTLTSSKTLATRVDDLEQTVGKTALGTGNTLTSLVASVQNIPANLSNTLETMQRSIAANTESVSHYHSVQDEVQNAHRYNEEHPGPEGIETDTLNQRFNDIETRLSAVDGGNAGSGDSLSDQVDALKTELENARTSTVVRNDNDEDKEYGSLDERLEAIETFANATSMASVTGLATKASAESVANLASDLENLSTTAYSASNPPPADATKQNKIIATGLLKGDGEGGVTTAVAGTDYLITHQDISGKLDANVIGGEYSSSNTVASAISGLDARLDILEGKDTFVFDKPVTGSNYTDGVPNIDSPSANADYLIQADDDKYYYWRYINDTWHLISGAGGGGTGTSSASILEELPPVSEGDTNVDYFIGNSTNGYTHYRYIETTTEDEGTGESVTTGHYVKMLPSNLISSLGVNTINVVTAAATDNAEAEIRPMSGGLTAYNIADNNTNLLADFTALRYVRSDVEYEGKDFKKQTLVFIDTNNNTQSIEIKGGGSSAAVDYSLRLYPRSSQNITVPNKTATVNISALPIVNFGNTLAPSGGLTAKVEYRLANAPIWTTYTEKAVDNNTQFDINVSSILRDNSVTEILLTVNAQPEANGTVYSKTINYTIETIALTINANNFNENALKTGDFELEYNCTGAGLERMLHITIDNSNEETISLNSANTSFTKRIDTTNWETGVHKINMYFTVENSRSNTVELYVLFTKNNEEQYLVAARAKESSINYGDELSVYYTVYSPNNNQKTNYVQYVIYTLNSNEEQVIYSSTIGQDIDNLRQNEFKTVNYPDPNLDNAISGETLTVYVQVNIVTVNTDMQVTSVLASSETAITVAEYVSDKYNMSSPVTAANVLYDYNPYGHTNNEINRNNYVYTFKNYSGDTEDIQTTFKDFSWSSNGYNDNALLINGGATMEVAVPAFVNNMKYAVQQDSDHSSILVNGRTVSIDYEVTAATKLNEPIITYYDEENNKGIKITPSICYLESSAARAQIDADGQFIDNEQDVAAAYLTTGQRMNITFVIEPKSSNSRVNIYINGAYANSCSYVDGTDFSVSSEIKLKIGHETCAIKLYRIKVYNKGLSANEVLQDYKLSPNTLAERIARFEENDVTNADGTINYEKARKRYNCLLLTGKENAPYVMSPYKGCLSPVGRQKNGETDGKVESGLTLTKPNSAYGYQVEFDLQDMVPSEAIAGNSKFGTESSYCSTNNVQGTSSQKYPTHNLKIYLAKWDSTNNAISKVKYAIDGYNNYSYDAETEKWSHSGPKSTEESTLCWKADYMSTDHANTYNANWAETLFTDDSPYQDTVHGIRCLLFVKQGNNEPVFIGDGCLNNDKGNNSSFGLSVKSYDEAEGRKDTSDTKRQKWEFTNNGKALGEFKTDRLFAKTTSGDVGTTGNNKTANYFSAKDAFECTYPDQGDLDEAFYLPNYNHLQLLLTWVNQRANYWEEEDSTLRAQKKQIFANEFQQHFNLNHVLTYYLFSEFIALCDNRVKNMFLRNDDITSETLVLKDGTNINLNTISEIANDEKRASQNEGKIYSANEQLLNATCTLNGTEYNLIDRNTGEVNADLIDWEHSTFTQWKPVLYDLDSCYGVENVGAITIKYNADWNYVWNNAHQFSGYDSVFWLMVQDTFSAELMNLAKDLYKRINGLNYTTIYQQQILNNENSTCAAIINEDARLKFIEPWKTGYINYSLNPPEISHDNYVYLARGTRAAQKSAFMKKRATYLSSIYQTENYKNDSITFRSSVKLNADQAQITLEGNQYAYHMIQFGDNNNFVVSQDLVAPNTACTLQPATSYDGTSTDGQGATDGIYIAGASILTSIGDISKFAPYQLVFSRATNLKELLLGSSTVVNARSNSITGIESCSLLQTLNVTNMSGLTNLDLSHNTMLEYVYAGGTGISNLLLPEDGVLKEVVLSPVTTNIKIINHRSLNTLTCNNYNNVTQLWVENASQNVMNGIVYTIFANRFANLTNGCRLVGINWELGDDPDGIITKLLGDSARNKYISNTGDVLEGGYPYLSGSIHVNEILSSHLDELKARYPLLSVSYTTKLEQNTIIYQIDDSNTFFTDYKLPSEAIIDPVIDKQIAPPVKQATPQNTYVFGNFPLTGNSIEQYEAQVANYEYHKFDGWIFSNGQHPTEGQTIAKSDTPIILTANFVAVPRGYKVYWYDQEEEQGRNLLKESPNKLPYGTLSSSFSAPTDLKARKVGNDYYAFTGWDKNIAILTEDINYYATWEKATIDLNASITDFNALSAADLYAISCQEAADRIRLLRPCLNADYTIELGHDFNYKNITNAQELVNVNNPRVFTGDTTGVWDTNIKPLDGNKAFTLAIDYKFLLDSARFNNMNELVLASCYYDDGPNKHGFRLTLVKDSNTSNPYIRITWGQGNQEKERINLDQVQVTFQNNQFVSATSYRNIVVLRHTEGSQKLYVYYRNPVGAIIGTVLGPVTTTAEPLEYGSTINNNMSLVFGGNYSTNLTSIENDSNTRRPAPGAIYWAKYWPVDLGANDCQLLAAWPHEKVTYRLGGYNDELVESSQRLVTDDSTKLNFVPLQAIGQRYYDFNTNGFNTTETDYGWSTAKVREYCNSILFKAFPIKFQSIIKQTAVQATNNSIEGSTNRTYNYLYLSSIVNVGNFDQPYTLESNNGKKWPWLVASNLPTVYSRDTESNLTTIQLETIYPMIVRFFDKYLSADASIYYMSTDPAANTWTYNGAIKTVQSGDMWIKTTVSGTSTTIDGYYIYINNEEKMRGINYTINSANGGWIESVTWATRTYSTSSSNNENSTQWLYRVTPGGAITTMTSANSNIYYRALCPEFSI